MGEHVRLNTKKEETGGSEVVEITFARNIEQPPVTRDSKDSDAVENGSESIAVWTLDRHSEFDYYERTKKHCW